MSRFSFTASIVSQASASAVCPSPTPAPASAPNTPLYTRRTSTKPTWRHPSSAMPRNSAPLSLSTVPSANSISSRPGTRSTPAAPPSWPTPAISSSALSPPSSTNSIPMTNRWPSTSAISLARSLRDESWLCSGKKRCHPYKEGNTSGILMRKVSNNASRQQRIQMHGEVIHRSPARFGHIFGPGTLLTIEERRCVANLYALFPADFYNAMARRNRRDHRKHLAVNPYLRALRRHPRPTIRVPHRQRRHPHIFLNQIRPVVSRAVACPQLLHVRHLRFQADGWPQVHHAGVTKFVLRINPVNRHPRPHHIQERVGALEKSEARSRMLLPERDAFLFQRAARFV